jgi:hypothetical protein
MASMLNKQINSVLTQVYKRAENLDESLLDETFLPIPQIDSLLSTSEHHVLYGRRGTGKTHTLRRLEWRRRSGGGAALYLDLRTIGSETGLYSDREIPFPSRATTLLVDVVGAIHEGILELALSDDRFTVKLDELTFALDSLANAATEVRVQGSVEKEISDTEEQKSSRGSEAKL